MDDLSTLIIDTFIDEGYHYEVSAEKLINHVKDLLNNDEGKNDSDEEVQVFRITRALQSLFDSDWLRCDVRYSMKDGELVPCDYYELTDEFEKWARKEGNKWAYIYAIRNKPIDHGDIHGMGD
jgi:hypothetical protein